MGGRFEAPVYVRSCAVYLPALRIKRQEYVKSLGTFSAPGVDEKAVADFDEDAVTMAVEAARAALEAAAGGGSVGGDVGGLYLASTTLPYAEKVQASTLREALGLNAGVFCCECTTSARAGTEALVCAARQVALERGAVLVVSSEAPWADPCEAAEHALGAGAAALVLAPQGWARLLGWYSFASESLGMRFRPTGSLNPQDLELRDYAQSALRTAVVEAVNGITVLLGETLERFKLVILPQLDARTPVQLARMLGLRAEQVNPAVVAARWGDLGSAGPFAALVAAVPVLECGDKVLLVCWGSGQAADAVALEVTSSPVVAVPSEGFSYIAFTDHLRRRVS
ncbi:MAG: hypothetical protein AB1609_18225 [Bacillota bacterium]